MSKIKKFIKKLEDKYDTEITLSTVSTQSVEAFVVDDRIEYLNLYNLKLNSLQDLLPIAKDLKKLVLIDCHINNLDYVEEFSQLTELILSYNPIAPELKKILKLENLKSLDISGIGLTETSILSEFEHLESLRISDNEFTHVLGLSNLRYLKELKVENSLIENSSNICSIASLEHLNLSQGEIIKLDGLERFQNLKELLLYHSSISSSSELSKLKLAPRLETLSLSFTQLSSISEIGEMPSLKALHCMCTQMTTIEGLEGLINLELLNFSGDVTYWNGDDILINKIEGLENLVNLKKLNLSQQNIKKIEGLEHLINLELLQLNYNKISKLENLPFNSLKGLNISYNDLSEVSGDMIHIEELLLIKNNINHINADWLNKIEGKCLIDLRGNPIEEIPPVPANITIKTGSWEPKRIRLNNW